VWVTEGAYDANAPIEMLWSVYADVACWSLWADDIVWARLEGPFRAGSSGRIRYRGTPPLRFTVVTVEAPSSYITEVPLSLARLTFDHRLTATEDGTRIVERISFSGPLSGLLGRIQGPRIKRSWPTAMARLDALAGSTRTRSPSAGSCRSTSTPSMRSGSEQKRRVLNQRDHDLRPLGEDDKRVQCLRAAYAAISRGDIDAALAALPLHPDVELVEPPQFVAGGHYRGAAEAEYYFRRSRAAWDELELVPDEFLDAGERVVALLRARGRPTAGDDVVEATFADVVTIAEGRLLRIEAYVDRDEAVRSVAAGGERAAG
jgi:ketosteroid isomerase-like protein